MGTNQPITILNVDDNDGSRYVLTRSLTQAGFHVMEASNGEEALQKLNLNPDVVILDVRLPDMSGFEVCQKIRTATHTLVLPVIMISAIHVGDKDKVEGLEGVRMFI
jgi:DNA-binding response OmpR family regulator